jgi:hypothetical protein
MLLELARGQVTRAIQQTAMRPRSRSRSWRWPGSTARRSPRALRASTGTRSAAGGHR